MTDPLTTEQLATLERLARADAERMLDACTVVGSKELLSLLERLRVAEAERDQWRAKVEAYEGDALQFQRLRDGVEDCPSSFRCRRKRVVAK